MDNLRVRKFHNCTFCWGLHAVCMSKYLIGRPEFMWATSVRSTLHSTVKVFSWYSHMNNFVLTTLMKCLHGQCKTVLWAHCKCINDYTVQPVSQTHFCSSLICTCKEMSRWVSNRTHISLVPSLTKSIRQIGCSKEQFAPLNTGVFGLRNWGF